MPFGGWMGKTKDLSASQPTDSPAPNAQLIVPWHECGMAVDNLKSSIYFRKKRKKEIGCGGLRNSNTEVEKHCLVWWIPVPAVSRPWEDSGMEKTMSTCIQHGAGQHCRLAVVWGLFSWQTLGPLIKKWSNVLNATGHHCQSCASKIDIFSKIIPQCH